MNMNFNLMNIIGTALPPNMDFDGWTEDWTNWATGKGGSVGSTADKSNELINFYFENRHYLSAHSGILNNFAGWFQTGWYTLLHGLATVTNYLMQAALAPLYYLPKYLMNPNSPLHVLYYGTLAIGISLIVVSFLSQIPKYLGGGRAEELKNATKSSLFTIGMLCVMPYVFVTGANMTHGVMKNVTQETMNPITPLAANTVDLNEWAMDNFAEMPFTGENNKIYNSLNKTKEVPDFAAGIDNDNVKMLEKLVEASGNKSIEQVPEVFKFRLIQAPTDPNDTNAEPQYTLVNLNLDKGLLNVANPQYKRYKVNNFAASASYIIFIVVSLLMSVKVARASLGTIGSLLGASIASGRDGARSTEGVKTSIMEILNSCIGIFLDVMMLWLFMSLSGTLPKEIATSIAPEGNIVVYSMVYVFILAMVGLVTFNGSSALERQFGLQSGAKGQAGTLRSMTAPGMMLGAGMIGGAGYLAGKKKEQRAREALERAKEPKPTQESGSRKNNVGEKVAQQMRDMERTPSENTKSTINNGHTPREQLSSGTGENQSYGNESKNADVLKDGVGMDIEKKKNVDGLSPDDNTSNTPTNETHLDGDNSELTTPQSNNTELVNVPEDDNSEETTAYSDKLSSDDSNVLDGIDGDGQAYTPDSPSNGEELKDIDTQDSSSNITMLNDSPDFADEGGSYTSPNENNELENLEDKPYTRNNPSEKVDHAITAKRNVTSENIDIAQKREQTSGYREANLNEPRGRKEQNHSPYLTQADLDRKQRIEEKRKAYENIVAQNKSKSATRSQNMRQRGRNLVNDLDKSSEDPLKPVK